MQHADRAGVGCKQCGIWCSACVHKGIHGAGIIGRVDVWRHVCGIWGIGAGAAGGALSV